MTTSQSRTTAATATEETVLSPGCKINLNLRILSHREDGYHELDSIFLPLSAPSDVLRVIHPLPPGEGSGLTLHCDDPALQGSDNLVARAYEAVGNATGFKPRLVVLLEKNVPVGAGLGGGSADCACMLRHCNILAGDKGLPAEELALLAATLGADVPFFLKSVPARARGIGEELQPIPEICDCLAGLCLLLVCPPVQVGTAWAYRAWDEKYALKKCQEAHIFLTDTVQQDKQLFCFRAQEIVNDFESVVFPEFPFLRTLKQRLLTLGAAAACMSGSGASLFGLFRDELQADAAAHDLRETGAVIFKHCC